MKITGFQPKPVQNNGKTEASKEPQGKGTRFAEILQGNLAPEPATGTNSAAAPPPLSGVAPALEPSQAAAAGISSDALDLLDHLSGLLSAPEVSPSALEQVADALEQKAEELMAARDSLSDGDPLRRQANEAGILSAVEAYKIRRGDYS